MYKAMIVEDEMLVRIGIRNVIKWDALGITLTEDAENGAQALELYRSERPDIILTDLRMPEMDGMSLIRNIRRQDKRCRFLIPTCVEDFEQAQEAIAYSVSGYLLKLTMDFKEVEKMLQKAVDELSVLPGGPSYVGMPNLSDAKERFFKEYFTLHNCNARRKPGFSQGNGWCKAPFWTFSMNFWTEKLQVKFFMRKGRLIFCC